MKRVLQYRPPTPINTKREIDDKPTMFAILVLVCILLLGVCVGIAMLNTAHPEVPVGVTK